MIDWIVAGVLVVIFCSLSWYANKDVDWDTVYEKLKEQDKEK